MQFYSSLPRSSWYHAGKETVAWNWHCICYETIGGSCAEALLGFHTFSCCERARGSPGKFKAFWWKEFFLGGAIVILWILYGILIAKRSSACVCRVLGSAGCECMGSWFLGLGIAFGGLIGVVVCAVCFITWVRRNRTPDRWVSLIKVPSFHMPCS